MKILSKQLKYAAASLAVLLLLAACGCNAAELSSLRSFGQTVRRRIRMHRGAVRRQGSAAGFSFRRPHVGTRRHLRSGSCVIERQKARRQRKLCIPRRGQYPFYGDGARQKIQQKRRNGERLFCRRTDVCRAEAVSEISGKNLK